MIGTFHAFGPGNGPGFHLFLRTAFGPDSNSAEGRWSVFHPHWALTQHRCPNLYSYWEGFFPLSSIHRVSFLSSRGSMFGFKEVVELRNFDSCTSSLFLLSSAFCSPTLSLLSLLHCSHHCVMEFLKGFYCSQACQWVFSSVGSLDEYRKERLGYYFFLTTLSKI